MPDKEIVLGKVGNIQPCLQRIRDMTDLDPEQLGYLDVQDIFLLNLQRAIQATIDLAAHVIPTEGLGLPTTLKEHFQILQRAGVIPEFLANKTTSMIGFRNIAIYNYESIDPEVVKAILKRHLPDLEEFSTAILKHYRFA